MKHLILSFALFFAISCQSNPDKLPVINTDNGKYKVEFVGKVKSAFGAQELYKITIDSSVIILSTYEGQSSMVKLK